MNTSTLQQQPLISPEKLSFIQAQIAAWVDKEAKSDDFAGDWAGASSMIGAGLISTDSLEPFGVITYG